jgi:RNA polymerase subunit RPABC4/transcription elongation factor Spt4
VSGLADPQAQPARPVAPPPPPRPPVASQTAPPVAPAARLDAWQCPKCHSASPVGTRYCRHCGDEIGRDCPKCGKLIEKSIRFCPECGVEVKTYIEEKQRLAEEYARRQQEEARRQAEEHARRETQEREQKQRRDRAILYVIAIFVVVIIVCASLWAVGSFAIEVILDLIRYR